MIGLPTCPGPAGVTGELVTPTAAALLRVLTGLNNQADKKRRDDYWQPNLLPGRPPSFIPRAVGLGAGTKDFERHPNILRLILGDCTTQKQTDGETDATKGTTTTATDKNQSSIHIQKVSTKSGEFEEEGKDQ
jgi:uncharacterized protein (DUF111 family)